MATAQTAHLRSTLALVACLLGCGDDGPAGDEGVTAASTSATTTDATMTATIATESSGGGVTCASQPCGGGCEPAMCASGDCSAYACNDAGECLPRDDFACPEQIDACMGHMCGDECFLPCEGDGACAASFCDPDGVCVYEALFEMRPCAGGSSTGSSTG